MKKYLSVYLGALIQIFAITCILKPNHLIVGGMTGLVLSLEKLIGINYTILYYIICMIILILSFFYLGKKQFKRIVLLSTTYPLILLIANKFSFNFIEPGTEKLVICIYYAIFMGLGTGLILREGFSQGASDTLSKILHKKIFPFLKLSHVMFGLDVIILLISLLAFSKTVVMYAILIQFIYSRVVEFVLFGVNDKIVKVVIISEKLEEMKKTLHDYNYYYSIGVVMGHQDVVREKLILVCTMKNSLIVKDIVSKIDKNVFINIVPTIGAWGKDPQLQKIELDE